ncbi:MAG: pSer/pThr/pTyr-binding forkhead associated (FHA) protein [Halioglobus sp.]
MAKSKHPLLTAIVGPSKGKRFTLKKETYACGADRKCAIRLKGEFVSDEHFIIRIRDDGNWIAENKSEYGTLVNAQRVETRILSDGDKIQIGTGNILVFSSAESTVREVPVDDGASGSSLSGKKIGIGVAIFVYVAAMIYGAMVLTGGDSTGTRTAIGIAQIESAVASTQEFMQGKTLKTNTEVKGARRVDKAAPSYRYFKILDLQSRAGNPAEIESEYQALEKELNTKMYAVYQLMSAGRNKAALKILDEVYATVPDVRAPITVLSLSLRTKIQRSESSE